jgi:NAD(P)-dependent dehydrogenase (short-subunit alcohol dehydrogenase family)
MRHALIVGAGHGISASVARALAAAGWTVSLASRNVAGRMPTDEGTASYACDAASAMDVEGLFARLEADGRTPSFVLYNASFRVRGPIVVLDPADVERALAVSAFGGFLVAQQAARRMLAKGEGAIFFTGASASVKGYAESAPFAMGKFALRGLAQSLARELQPQGVHVAHFVIDGGVRSSRRPEDAGKPDALLDPDAIAQTYLAVLGQPRSAWSTEVELRPWTERF